MGLAGAKKRTKLSTDPNNTAWTKSTSNFGHKILAAQGWKPGDYLGAKDAPHADHYTAANASHIRIALREDNLGLGAKLGKGNAETFGLSMFSGLLGRLNGKEEGELKRQEEARRDVELRAYSAQKYGFMNFVRGGLLVGDKIEKVDNPAKIEVPKDKAIVKAGRKRKAAEAEDLETDEPSSRKKKEKKSSKSELEAVSTTKNATSTEPKSKSKSRNAEEDANDKSTKERSKEARKQEKARRKEAERQAKAASSTSATDDEAVRKAEKRARKEARRKRKEEKRKKRGEASVEKNVSTSSDDEDNVSPPPPLPSAPPAIKPAPALANLSRHAVRQRYIQQKRLASMDPKALKEIFMLKAA